jgi:hypothetical protein
MANGAAMLLASPTAFASDAVASRVVWMIGKIFPLDVAPLIRPSCVVENSGEPSPLVARQTRGSAFTITYLCNAISSYCAAAKDTLTLDFKAI